VEAGDELTIHEMCSIIRAARGIGLSSVKLTGGEPFLRKDIGCFIRECGDCGLETTIETNGTLVDDRMAELMAGCGIEQISVSLDSFNSDIHDSLRGRRGAFLRTVTGIRRMVDRALSVQVILSLYDDRVESFKRFLDLMNGLGVRDVKVNIISPMGRGRGLYSSEELPGVDRIITFDRSTRRLREEFSGKVYVDIPSAFRPVDELKTGGGCSACAIKNILGVLSDGRVSMCGVGYMDDTLIFGRLKDDPERIAEIWNSEPVLKVIRDDMPEHLQGVCGRCVMKGMCMGGCRADAYHNTGDLMAPYWFCQEAFDRGLFPATRILPERAGA
jgi:SynChlorMet cassette radical SAM/SPASM protein ScmF